jgi:hypothetical protein
MVNFIVFVAIVGSGLAVLVFAVIIFLIMAMLFARLTERGNHSLPEPDKAADRPWGQKYFERAINRRLN